MNHEIVREDTLAEVLQQWNLQLKRTRPDLGIGGSPERSAFRMVVEDQEEKLFVLEQIFPESFDQKLKIINTLNVLFQRGLTSVQPYLPAGKNEFIVTCGNRKWQLVPYIGGKPLKRPDYISERWRGICCTDFLLELRERSTHLPFFEKEEPFSLNHFIMDLMHKIRSHNPEWLRRLLPVTRFLEAGFFKAHDEMPSTFCHGDFHPLNILWSGQGIRSVIDWEFLGIKPENYDVANLMGCVGMETPEGLTNDFVVGLLDQLREAGMLTQVSWEFLLETVVASRFGWLSDWLRRRDTEMVDLEVTYMNLLVDNQDHLKKAWLLNLAS